jgi:hypothetical protein
MSRLILSGINGRYLREITDNAGPATEYVEAAVAYVTDDTPLRMVLGKENTIAVLGKV